MKDQLDSPITDENNITTRGKGLGMAGMIIGLVAVLWSIIPMIGAASWVIGVIGFVLSVIAVIRGRKNPHKGMMLSGIILNGIAIVMSVYWIWRITTAYTDIQETMQETMKEIDSAAAQQEREQAKNADSTNH